MSRRLSFALAGGCLAQGAAAGLLVVRLLSYRQLSVEEAIADLRSDPVSYLYVAWCTTAAFALFGAVVGRYADHLAELATTDSMTGLLNVRAFGDRFRQELARARRYRQPLSVLILDVDGLKGINDRYGHPTGDRALQGVARAIRDGLRASDVGARIGGDEFGVLAPNLEESAALKFGERLRELVARGGGFRDVDITVSIGIARLPAAENDHSTVASLIRAADAALYQAKRDGGNRVRVAMRPRERQPRRMEVA